MEYGNVSSCVDEFNALDAEFKDLEEIHKQYLQKLEDLHAFQNKCLAGINHQRYRMKVVSKSIGKIVTKGSSEEDCKQKAKLEKDMIKRQMKFRDMEEYLPHQSGRYLRIILGSVNVSFLNKNDRYNYKDEYEKFKLIVTFIGFMLSFTNLVFLNYRFMDLAIMFLLVWYYCTLTIRESILKVNGSKIKGWWRTHHFLSTVAAGVLLIWPDGDCYQQFRKQFLMFNCYIAVIQFLQFRYQQGCLYRLKALGERHNMDITIEGFHSWMWRGLSFLLPLLFFGYFFQLYNGYTLYLLSLQSSCKEWQIPVLSVLFFVIFLGNMFTTSMVIPQKLKIKTMLKYRFSHFMKRNSGSSTAKSKSEETPDERKEK